MVPSSAFLISIYQCQAPRMQLDSRVCVYSRLRYLSGSFAPHTLSTTFSSFSTFSSQSSFCFLQYAAELSHASSDVKYQSHHFVEARRVLQAVSDFYQAAFLVVLLRPDVVQLDGQLLHVRPEVLDCLQPVREVTERGGLVRNILFLKEGAWLEICPASGED